MIKSLDYILTTRDATVGHWRFRNDPLDDTNNGNHLTFVGDHQFSAGHSERGVTAIETSGQADSGCNIPVAEASDFDMGTDDFSVEVIFNPTVSTGGQLVGKRSSGTDAGWAIVLALQQVYFFLGDGVNTVTESSNTSIPNGLKKWYQLTLTVDRSLNQARLYIDGVEDSASPFDISAITGNISDAAADLQVVWEFNGSIDEICISKELLTPAAVADRAAGRFSRVSEDNPTFLQNFLPRIDHDNAALTEFLRPFTDEYLNRRQDVSELNDLSLWDRCPDRYLGHLASLFGFELIDGHFATPQERRSFFKWITWIYKRKGMAAAGQKIIELLGFTYDWAEVYPDWTPFVLNAHRLYSRDLIATTSFEDDFSRGNLAQWNPPLQLDSWWRIAGDKLRGTGDGTSSALNGLVFNDSSTDYYMEALFQILDGFDVTVRVGFYLKYVDVDNWVRLVIRSSWDHSYLTMEKQLAGDFSMTDLCETTDIFDQEVGIHKLWVYANHDTDVYTIGVDDNTLVYKVHYSTSGIDSGRKGLFANHHQTIEFDDVSVQTIDKRLTTGLIWEEFPRHIVQLKLHGSPEFEDAKQLYLQRVLPKYLPFFVRLAWPYSPQAPARISFGTGGISLKTGFLLSGDRAVGITFGTGGISYVLSSMTMTPEPVGITFGTRFDRIVMSPGSVDFILATGSISHVIMVLRESGIFGRSGHDIIVNKVQAWDHPNWIIDGDKETEGSGFDLFYAIGIKLQSAGTIDRLILYDADANETVPDGLQSGSNNKLRIFRSSVEVGSWSIHSTEISLTRIGRKIIIDLSTPITQKYILLYTHDGRLQDPNGKALWLSELEAHST